MFVKFNAKMKELYIQVSTLLEMSRVYGKQQTSDSS